MNSNHLSSQANSSLSRPLIVLLTVLSFFLFFNFFSTGRSKASNASYTEAAAEQASVSKAAQQTNKKSTIKKITAKPSGQLNITPQAATPSGGLFMLAGANAGTAFGDYVAVPAGLDTYYRYFIEVPAGTTRLVVDIFDADIGMGTTSEADAGRDRARGSSFSTTVNYSLLNPSGTAQTTEFTTGNTTTPTGADGEWLSLYDTSETWRDEFETAAYNNNDGSRNWAANWDETNDDDNVSNGQIRITGGELRIGDNGNSNTSRIEREANLSGLSLTSATLSFDFRTTGVDAGDTMIVEISANGGGAWTTLETFTGPFSTASSRSYNITSSIASNTRVRFRHGTNYGSNDFFFVNNLQILGNRAVAAGHWELRVDMSDTYNPASGSNGDDINAIGLRAHDGDTSSGGAELNMYADSMNIFGVNPPTSGTNTHSYTFYPYITSGCKCSKNDFDFDSNSGDVGSMLFTGRVTSFTQSYATTALSTNDTWRRDTFSGWTTDASAVNYGIWTADLLIKSYLVDGNQNGNYTTFYMGDFNLGDSQNPAPAPTSNPFANTFRLYLPKDDGTKPAKPYLTQTFALVSGINPPQSGQATRYAITVSLVNPTAQSISLAGSSNVVTVNVPGSGTVYRDFSTHSQGSLTEPSPGATGNLVWTPGTVAAGATATLTYRVDVTPTSNNQRVFMTGLSTSANGTRAQFVDETGNTSQTRATYLLGPLCELAVTSQAPTAVDLVGFRATEQENGVLLQWQTGFEADNLGFNIYRQEAGNRHLVNHQLIAGSALTTGLRTVLQAGQAYSWSDHSQAKDAIYWLEDIDLNGLSTFHGPFGVQAAPNQQAGSAAKPSPAKLLEQLNQETPPSLASSVVEKTASLTLPARASAAQNLLQASLTSQQAVKIAVTQEGWYRLTQGELVSAGLDPNTNPSLLQLSVEGRQLPIKVLTNKDGHFDQSSAIEFYGLGLNTPSTDTRIYWLSVGSQAGLRIAETKADGSPSAQTSFATTVERKERTIYFSSLRNGEKENFFGAVVASAPVTQQLLLTNVEVTASKQAELEVALQGVTLVAHRVAVQINGFVVGEVLFSGQQAGLSKFAIQPSWLKEGVNTVQLMSLSSPSDVNLVDFLRLTYQHTFVADEDALKLNVTGQELVTIDGFSKSSIRVFDVTNESSVKELQGEIVETKTGYAISAASPDAGPRTWLALTDEKAKSAASIKENQSSNWRSQNQGADLIIVSATEFLPALEALKMVRQSEGYRVALVDIEDIYDEYAFGQKTPQAVKDFLSSAKTSWKIGPSYLLLAGDASFDAKNYLGRGNYDLVPTKLIDTNYMETASDDWFADFNNDGLSELAVGRLPMRTLAEGSLLMSKLVNYEKSAESESVLLVSDATDGYNFEQASSRLRGVLPGSMSVEEVKRGQVDAATAKQQLLDGLNRGQKLVNYAGHGSVNLWRGNLLTSEEAKGLSNGERLPMFVMMTCLNGYFQDPVLDSLSESLLKAENGGAIAVWASSTLTEPDPQSVMNQELYRLLFQNMTIGEAIVKAKASITDSDVRRSWILFGDPTMKLR